METRFSLAQLADPDMAASEKVLRTCVHCGFCTATCPTYVLLGDELDSPRGRIYLMKDMLEGPDSKPSAAHVKHIDRCLSCLSCMTTCPSGVHYMHLVDHARAHIEEHYERPWFDRTMRRVLGYIIPRPWAFRLALLGAMPAKILAGVMPKRIGAMLRLAKFPAGPSASDRPQTHQAHGTRRARVALLTGCAQTVLAPSINQATVRVLTRHGVDVVVPEGAGCCGSLNHHMGQHDAALALVKANVAAWDRLIQEPGGLDAIIINASGCGTTVKDYGWMLRDDAVWAERAARVASLAKDVTEFLDAHGLDAPVTRTGQTVAYHSACSMQHGQKIRTAPKTLLTKAGFTVRDVPEGHICCGSAGTYNMLQPDIAGDLARRKRANIASVAPDIVAAGNIGCMTQIADGSVPVVHTVELLDWATGGPKPQALH